MTNEERDIISRFIARVAGNASQTGFPAGSVPALPPIDREADNYIAQLFNQYPEARYRITQLAFVQEHALVEAQNRIKRLEWELQQARQALQQAQAQQPAPRSGGLLGSLFGGGSRQQSAPPPAGPQWNQGGATQPGAAQPGAGYGQSGYGQSGYQQPGFQQSAPPPPQYPPNYQQGVLPRQGSGFLGSALTTAAGVAGGMVVGNALMDLFSPRHEEGPGGMTGGGGNPWGAPAGDQGQVDAGAWNAGGGNQDYVDNGSWDQQSNNGGWTDNSGGTDGGWDQGNGGDPGGWDQGGGSDNGWDQGGGTDDTF